MRRAMIGLSALAAVALMLFVADTAQAQRRGGGIGVRTPGGWGFSYGDRGFNWGPSYGWDGRYGGYGRYGWDGYNRYGWDGYRYDRPYYRSYYVDPGYYSAPTYVSPTYVAPSGSLSVEVHVPRADAAVWINGQRSTQSGMTRHFTVQEIVPGQTYQYEVTATWNEDGRPVSQTRMVSGQAGQTLQVVFDGRGTS